MAPSEGQQPTGCAPNAFGEHPQPFRHVPLRALRATGISRMMRQRHARHGFARALEIQQQRHDRDARTA